MTTIYTIGHSNMSIESFVELLQHHGIEALVDIRSDPGSSHCPWFNQNPMRSYLMNHDIEYVHIPKLGGKRPIQWKVSRRLNSGWRNPSFHNYADYSLSLPYEQGLTQLVNKAKTKKTAFGCKEREYWNCHRLLVSNTLSARGYDVYHINGKRIEKHELGKCGASTHIDECCCVTYPSDKPVQMQLSI